MRSRSCTVALQCLIPQTPFPQASRRFTVRTKWGRAFFNAQREGCALFSSCACRRASRSYTPGVALSEPLLGMLSKRESGGVRRPSFQLQSKGEGRAFARVAKKVAGYFSKVHDFRAKHVAFCAKLPRFLGACLQRADERNLPVFHTPREGKSPRAGCLAFPCPRNLQRP